VAEPEKQFVMNSIKPAALTAAKWIGTGAGVSGAIMIALNIGLVIYGFGLFLISSLLWSVIGWLQREMSPLVLQGAFTIIINIVGIYRWLGL
jgi:nicotinamide riboside transporter PnuC